jgi:transposase-like protein
MQSSKKNWKRRWERRNRRAWVRDLAEDQIQYLIMDGWYPKVRIGKRRERVPVLVTLGVRGDGERVVLDVRLAGDESTAAWRDVIRSLVDRHVGAPRLAMIDGRAGLAAALRAQCPLWRSSAARQTSCGIWRRRRRCGCARSSQRTTGG